MKDLAVSQVDPGQDCYPQPKLMWTPDPTRWTHIHTFRKLINTKFDLNLENYHDLQQWSCENYPQFWQEFWHYSKIVYSRDYEQVVDKVKSIVDIPEWFVGSRLNYAENLLRFRGSKIALYAAVEGRQKIESRTFDELRDRVALFASAMKRLGIAKGDRVVGYIPNCIEAIEAMLATASIGAIWSSTSPDFGSTGVLERFSQIQPKLILSVTSVVYNGRSHNHLEKLQQVVLGLPYLEQVVLIPSDGDDSKTNDISGISKAILLNDFLKTGQTTDGRAPTLLFEQVPFNHPLFIMYSSGTTGVPKCIVHSQGGTLIQHMKEHMMQGNLTSDDIIMYYTTAGWMMWNWLVTALAVGATVVLYDGSPLVPTPHVLWDLVDRLKITVLGTGAKWLAVLEEKGIHPKESHRLDSLHTILSTGSPLKPHSYDYVYEYIKKDLVLGSISGGTDIIGCFMGQNPTLPVYRGEIQSCHLAMAMECWVDQDKPVLGQSGELVCTKPHPSMPISFWNDQDGSKYRKAYFSNFKGVWCHGDFCCINPVTRGLVMLGRSDGTLNPNGVRFGSAEIYNIVEAFKEVEDSLCVAQRNSSGEERVILFVKMVPSMEFGDEIVRGLQVAIRVQLSSRHVPAIILETKEIPYTISGKKVEVAVRDIIAGREVKYRGAIGNPNCLDAYRDLPLLGGF